MHQEHIPTSLSSFPRAIYFLLAGSEHEFFCLLTVKYCVKKVCRLHCRCIYRNVCPDCKHGESVTIRGVGAWDHAPRWGKKAKNGIQIGKTSASKGRSRLPLGLLRSPIFFLFPPMRSLVPGYYERGTNHT